MLLAVIGVFSASNSFVNSKYNISAENVLYQKVTIIQLCFTMLTITEQALLITASRKQTNEESKHI